MCWLGADWWLSYRQREPGVVLRAVCLVWGCAPMRNAGDVYFLMVCDQLGPKKLSGSFLRASRFQLIALLLVSRRCLMQRVGVKDDADWRRHMWCDHHADHIEFFSVKPCGTYSNHMAITGYRYSESTQHFY